MKEKCDDKEWKDCRVEKMGYPGCYYFQHLEKKGKQYMK